VSKTKKKYQCDFCGKECKTKFDLKVHRAVHTGDKPLKCNICDASFALRARLKNHLKTHKTHCCPEADCDFNTNKWSLFRKHLSCHKQSCQFCSKSFTSKESLKAHEAKHGQKLYCPQCPASYSNPSNLKTHVRTCHDHVFFACSVGGCDKEFAHRKTLKHHVKMHHSIDQGENTKTAKESLVPKVWRRTVAFAELMSGFDAPDAVRIEILEEDKDFRRELVAQTANA